jgi:hypothetical protein
LLGLIFRWVKVMKESTMPQPKNEMPKNSGWTPERRKKQTEAIRQWKPWNQSTGPKSLEGKAAVAGNAWNGGTRLKLRQAIKALNQVMREQRDWLA